MNGSVTLAYPGDLDTRTGGYRYDRRVAQELEALGWHVTRTSLPASFPFPDVRDLNAAERQLMAAPPADTLLIDGLAFGAMPELAAKLARRQRLVALVHHPLGYESGLGDSERARLLASERRALGEADHIVVTSPTTAATLQHEFGIAGNCITVAVPGTNPRPPANGSGRSDLQLLNVGSLTPRKDQITLVRALARIATLRWRLSIAGSAAFAPQTARDLKLEIARLGLERRVLLVGELIDDRLEEAYRSADLFVSSSIYEGYGMAIMEAIASGLPVVATRGGAVENVVPAKAAILVPAGDPDALAEALENVLRDPALRQRLQKAALLAREQLPRWADTARLVAGALR